MSPDQWFEIARNIPLLREINAPAFEILRREASSISLGAGQLLYRVGDPADSLYVVLDGRVRVEVPMADPDGTEVLAELEPAEVIGELALLRGKPRSAQVRAVQEANLVRIRKATLDRMLAQDAEFGKKLEGMAARRMAGVQIASVHLLAGTERAFGPSADLESNWLRLGAGETLVRQGDPPDFLYVSVSGRLEVVRERPGQEDEVLDLLPPGAILGELALLAGDPHPATVRAVRRSEVVRVSRAQYLSVLEKQPEAAQQIFRRLAPRLLPQAAPRARGRTNICVIACVPARRGKAYERFVAMFAESLSRFGATSVLGGRWLEQRSADLSDGSRSERRLAEWIQELENKNRYVVVDCGTPHASWNKTCLMQADVILVVTDADDDPEPEELEQSLYSGELAPRTRRELVLLHSGRSRLPDDTRRRLAARPVSAHHHLAAGDTADAGRLARVVTGNSVGVVLGGGGARGYAQIGVLKAMCELGIPVDACGGTSFGALIAAQVAMGRDLERIVEVFGGPSSKGLPGRGILRNLTPPFASFASGRGYVRALKSWFGESDIEDLWLPFFSVSASLTTRRPIIADQGPLWLALRSTSSLAGILPPVRAGGELLVDGSVLDNLPAGIMKARCGGHVIAVDAGHAAPCEGGSWREPRAVTSGWNLLWRRSLRRPEPVPGFLETLWSSSTMAGARGDADVYLLPPAAHIGTFEWKRAREGVEIGYRYALEKLAERQELPRIR